MVVVALSRFRKPVALGECIDGWRVLLGGRLGSREGILRRDGEPPCVCDSSQMT